MDFMRGTVPSPDLGQAVKRLCGMSVKEVTVEELSVQGGWEARNSLLQKPLGLGLTELPQGKIWICLDFVGFGFLWDFSPGFCCCCCFWFGVGVFFIYIKETGSTYFPSSQIPAAAGNTST